ncbi:putative pyrophosphatase [Bradyrhizobium sp. YR681]|uniref:nucleoside triphosphate pyrophosphohydrolase family protein n=1 Tax=Bradyrhizobium sp. YR681 TaxID=1144344 RepID=UPI000270D7E9|nr:nucleoside triphosphate pyrophosphohydrolase family protein [Bradyrhizobium sp. YR681]EJN12127.1 putative pyrophosphatase [Bradyrhizobium sp. YR681]
MTIDDYADWAAAAAKVTQPPASERLAYLGLGLTGESGEVAEHIKKLLRDGTLDQAAMAEELGDVVYYWACLCSALGRKPSDVLAASKAKISARLAR